MCWAGGCQGKQIQKSGPHVQRGLHEAPVRRKPYSIPVVLGGSNAYDSSRNLLRGLECSSVHLTGHRRRSMFQRYQEMTKNPRVGPSTLHRESTQVARAVILLSTQVNLGPIPAQRLTMPPAGNLGSGPNPRWPVNTRSRSRKQELRIRNFCDCWRPGYTMISTKRSRGCGGNPGSAERATFGGI